MPSEGNMTPKEIGAKNRNRIKQCSMGIGGYGVRCSDQELHARLVEACDLILSVVKELQNRRD